MKLPIILIAFVLLFISIDNVQSEQNEPLHEVEVDVDSNKLGEEDFVVANSIGEDEEEEEDPQGENEDEEKDKDGDGDEEEDDEIQVISTNELKDDTEVENSSVDTETLSTMERMRQGLDSLLQTAVDQLTQGLETLSRTVYKDNDWRTQLLENDPVLFEVETEDEDDLVNGDDYDDEDEEELSDEELAALEELVATGELQKYIDIVAAEDDDDSMNADDYSDEYYDIIDGYEDSDEDSNEDSDEDSYESDEYDEYDEYDSDEYGSDEYDTSDASPTKKNNQSAGAKLNTVKESASEKASNGKTDEVLQR